MLAVISVHLLASLNAKRATATTTSCYCATNRLNASTPLQCQDLALPSACGASPGAGGGGALLLHGLRTAGARGREYSLLTTACFLRNFNCRA